MLLVGAVVALFSLDLIFRQWPLPILIELRRYQGEPVEQFLKIVVIGAVGGRAISDQLQGYVERGRLIWLLDGVNEMKGSAYGSAIEGWRGCLKPGQFFDRSAVIFTSRAGQEDPTFELGLEEVLRPFWNSMIKVSSNIFASMAPSTSNAISNSSNLAA